MPRASDAQKAQRLNRARELLRQFKERAQAVTELARECSISLRQAHRYIQQAQQLKQPIPVSEGKLAFTVKLPRGLIQRVRLYARARKLPVSEVVARALLALVRSEEHTSELQSLRHLVCRLLLEKKKNKKKMQYFYVLRLVFIDQ